MIPLNHDFVTCLEAILFAMNENNPVNLVFEHYGIQTADFPGAEAYHKTIGYRFVLLTDEEKFMVSNIAGKANLALISVHRPEYVAYAAKSPAILDRFCEYIKGEGSRQGLSELERRTTGDMRYVLCQHWSSYQIKIIWRKEKLPPPRPGK
jgi:hypothetical protein